MELQRAATLNEISKRREHPLIYVAILNWNGWGDTIECLESVLRQTYPNFRIIVCDNGSRDDSIEYIKMWARGCLDVGRPRHDTLRHLSYPPIRKPISYADLGLNSALKTDLRNFDKKLLLLRTGTNLGFAGGYNRALRYVLSHAAVAYVWLLNNDTAVAPGALSELANRMLQTHSAGMCGSTLLEFDNPTQVQALGGAQYNRLLGTHKPIGSGKEVADHVIGTDVEKKMSYVIAASMLVSTPFLQVVGVMSEDYFLYFEEIDWAVRAKKKFSLAYAPQSIVYHKGGGSSGSKELGERADYFALRNRLLFTYRRAHWVFPLVWLSYAGVLLNRLRRKQFRRSWAVVKIMFGDWKKCPKIA
jgi:GT2 family glycosyltransferase